jgi:hypothetical protein
MGGEPTRRPGEQETGGVHPAGLRQLHVLGEEADPDQDHENSDPVGRPAVVRQRTRADELHPAGPPDHRVAQWVRAVLQLEHQHGHTEHDPERRQDIHPWHPWRARPSNAGARSPRPGDGGGRHPLDAHRVSISARCAPVKRRCMSRRRPGGRAQTGRLPVTPGRCG